MTMVAGTVQYYDGAVDGTIGLATFYSLQILGPARTFTLSQDITVGPAAGTGLLQISGGVLDVSGASHSITLRGNWRQCCRGCGFQLPVGVCHIRSTRGRDDLGLGSEHLVCFRMPGAERHDPVPGRHAAEDQELPSGRLSGSGARPATTSSSRTRQTCCRTIGISTWNRWRPSTWCMSPSTARMRLPTTTSPCRPTSPSPLPLWSGARAGRTSTP